MRRAAVAGRERPWQVRIGPAWAPLVLRVRGVGLLLSCPPSLIRRLGVSVSTSRFDGNFFFFGFAGFNLRGRCRCPIALWSSGRCSQPASRWKNGRRKRPNLPAAQSQRPVCFPKRRIGGDAVSRLSLFCREGWSALARAWRPRRHWLPQWRRRRVRMRRATIVCSGRKRVHAPKLSFRFPAVDGP